MSSETVELARASVDAFNRGDLDWLLEHIDDDFEFDWSRSRGPLAGVYRGRAGLTEFCREQWETFETFHMEALEYIDCGRFVVVPNKVSARGPKRNRGLSGGEPGVHAGARRAGVAGGDVSGAGGGAGGDEGMTPGRPDRVRSGAGFEPATFGS